MNRLKYFPRKEVEEAKKAGNHDLFDKWRKEPEEKRINEAQYWRDVEESANRYQAAWEAALKRLGLDETAAEAS